MQCSVRVLDSCADGHTVESYKSIYRSAAFPSMQLAQVQLHQIFQALLIVESGILVCQKRKTIIGPPPHAFSSVMF
jgi:hypothetical protein